MQDGTFKLHSDYAPTGDQPGAIAALKMRWSYGRYKFSITVNGIRREAVVKVT